MTQFLGLVGLRDLERQYEPERKIKIDISKTQYSLFRQVALKELGWTIWGKEDQKGDANIFWNDTYITEQQVKRLKPYQRINHFPNSQQLGRKNLLTLNLKKMKQLMPRVYDFYPETWTLPEDENHLKSSSLGNSWLIIKPSSSSQGKGIYLTNNHSSIAKQPSVAQQYIGNPHLIDGCKYDLRIYVLIKSLEPLKIFRYDEGLARLATSPYEPPSKLNKHNMNIHLTNYAINKLNPAYIPNRAIDCDSVGHKRSLAAIFRLLQTQGCDTNRLKTQIDEILVKTILAAYPKLLLSYKNCRDSAQELDSVCFQVLGFDVIIDEDFRPWLLEVNHSPSFCTDSPLDFVIKRCLLLDTFLLLNLDSRQKQLFLKVKSRTNEGAGREKGENRLKRMADSKYEATHLGGFKRIFPTQNDEFAQILNTVLGKKAVNNLRLKIPKAAPPEKKSVDSSRRHEYVFESQLDILKARRSKAAECKSARQDEDIRGHLSLERPSKKEASPIKMNNVSISFYEDMRTQYQNGFESHSYSNNARKPLSSGKALEQSGWESRTAEGSRREINKIDYEIRSRIGKMKLARIKLQRIKSKDREEPLSTRTLRHTPLRDQLRGSNKIA